MKNTLTDLHNHLMAQIERLGDENIASDPEKLEAEIQRSKTIAQLAGTAVSNARVMLDASKHLHENNGSTLLPKLLANGAGGTANPGPNGAGK